MGVELETNKEQSGPTAPLILGLQPAALLDHVARVDASLLSQIPGESGGSFPVIIFTLFVYYWLCLFIAWFLILLWNFLIWIVFLQFVAF